MDFIQKENDNRNQIRVVAKESDTEKLRDWLGALYKQFDEQSAIFPNDNHLTGKLITAIEERLTELSRRKKFLARTD